MVVGGAPSKGKKAIAVVSIVFDTAVVGYGDRCDAVRIGGVLVMVEWVLVL